MWWRWQQQHGRGAAHGRAVACADTTCTHATYTHTTRTCATCAHATRAYATRAASTRAACANTTRPLANASIHQRRSFALAGPGRLRRQSC